MTKFTGAGGVFCAAHEPKGGGPIHGHTWQVIAWFKPGDAEMLRDRLQTLLKSIDHGKLPEDIVWGEDIAEWIGRMMQPWSPVRIQVNRPLEHIYAEWTPDAPQQATVSHPLGEI